MIETHPDGRVTLNLHPGQAQALASKKRIVLVLAGHQSGKSEMGPWWLFNEIKEKGPGDYMVVTPNYPLLEKKALPAFRRLFEGMLSLGRYVGSPTPKFVFSEDGMRRAFGGTEHQYHYEGTQVFFAHALQPETLAAATIKAAWLDEAGQQQFKLAAWEEIQRRLSINDGRTLISTLPYCWNWLYRDIYQAWMAYKKVGRDHPDIDVINFASNQNPAFPQAVWDRALRSMATWKFDMTFRGKFTRPAGMIYEEFTDDHSVIESFTPPPDWPCLMVGLDFGGVHTAATFYTQPPGSEALIAYEEYLAGHKTAAQHVRSLKLKAGRPILMCVGGAKAEQQWRKEFTAAGLFVGLPSVSEVEVGIDRVADAIKVGRLKVMKHCKQTIEDLSTYAREVDEAGEVTDRIANKDAFHVGDSVRYAISHLHRPEGFEWDGSMGHGAANNRSMTADIPDDVYSTAGEMESEWIDVRPEDMQW